MVVKRILIRPFERADQKASRRLILKDLSKHFGFIDETKNPDLDDIYSYYVQTNNAFIVAVYGNDTVGTGVL